MTSEIEKYWETKRNIERKLLMGACTLLMILWTAACSQSPTGPYTALEVESGEASEELQAEGYQEQTPCGGIEVSEAVCAKGRPDPDL